MKLIVPELGRVTSLFVADEIRPLSAVPMDSYFRAIAERYNFTSLPAQPDPEQPGPAVFQGGYFSSAVNTWPIVRLQIYNDALQVDSIQTDYALAILNDVLEFSKKEFHYREPISKPFLLFESNVVVEFGGAIHSAVRIFEEVQSATSKAMSDVYEQRIQMEFNALALASDPLSLPPPFSGLLRSDFSIIRRVNRPFSENRYFCCAGLPTEIHLKLLEQFEVLAVMAPELEQP